MGKFRRNFGEVIKKRISVTYPIGGWKLIFDRLIEKIKKNNAKILTKQKVEEVIIENKCAIGGKTKDQTFYAKKTILSSPVQEIFNFLDESYCEPEFVELCKNLRPTGGLSIDFTLKTRISEKIG